MEYICINSDIFNSLLAAGQGVSTFRVLNYVLEMARANHSDVITFKYNDIADILGYGIRCIGDSVRYLCKLGVLVKTGRHEYVIDKKLFNVTFIDSAF